MEHRDRPQERLRFDGLDYRTLPDGSSRLEVRLEWGGNLYVGRASGSGTLEGDLRASAEATLTAATAAVRGDISIGLIGIKAVRAFDGRVIIAAVEVRVGEHQHKVLGAHALTAGDVPRAAALSILDAMNRLVAPFLHPGGGAEEPASGSATGES